MSGHTYLLVLCYLLKPQPLSSAVAKFSIHASVLHGVRLFLAPGYEHPYLLLP